MKTHTQRYLAVVIGIWHCCAVVASAQVDHANLRYYLDDAGQPQRVVTVEDWEKRRAEILAGMQAAMGPLPSRDNLPAFDVKIRDEVQQPHYRRVTLDFVVEAGDRLPVDLYVPLDVPDDAKLPAIVALHPTGALGKRIVAGEGPRPNRQYASELAQRGYIVIAPDYPSFGDYPYDFNNDAYVSGTMKGIFNHMRCIDFLIAEVPGVDPARIGVIGHSLGGHNAMFLGVFDQRVQVIVSSCGWTPFHDYYEGHIKGWTSDRYMPKLATEYELDPSRVPFDFYEVVAALAPRGFYSSSPLEDANFAVTGVLKAIPKAQDIYDLHNAGSQLILETPHCDHDFPTETRERTYEFLDRLLNHSPRKSLDYAAELPRIAPLEPSQALKSFSLVPGFELQQTAAEPLITDPVAMSFDAQGRLYVIEMRDYSEQDKELLGQVRLLEDRDHDGRYETSSLFADKLSWPTAIICSKGGVYVGAAPDIIYLRDNDGDNRADERKVVFTGFARSNIQGLLNSFRWGLDNRIHGATSSSGGEVYRPEDPDRKYQLRGRDFSFDPVQHSFRAESGGAQHGISFDLWGRKFVCSNSDHAQHVIYDDRYLARNPHLVAPGPRRSIADDGGQAPVFRASPIEPWRIVRTRLRVSKQVAGIVEGGGRPAGYFTGATGITIYRGDAFQAVDYETAFIGDVGSNIVHRKRLIPDGSTFTATRIDEGREFLASSDIWFRPVQFANAPDGCLHILDMYREVIEHPKSLPPQIKQHLDLTSGRDRGRLYRVVPAGVRLRNEVNLERMTGEELVDLLAHPNGWHRETASRLLFERQDRTVSAKLTRFARECPEPLGRVHALHVLRALALIEEDHLKFALEDTHPRVLETAVKLSEPFAKSVVIQKRMLALLQRERDPRLNLQLAFTLGELPLPLRLKGLTQILSEPVDDWVITAALSSLDQGAGEVLSQLVANREAMPFGQLAEVLRPLAQLIARQHGKSSPPGSVARGESSDLDLTLEFIGQLPVSDQRLRSLLLVELTSTRSDLQQQIVTGEHASLVQKIIDDAATIAVAEDSTLTERIAAVRVLSLGKYEQLKPLFLQLLDSSQPRELQSVTMTVLGKFGIAASPVILDQWLQFSPGMRAEAENIILQRPATTLQLLERIQAEQIPRAEVSANLWTVAESSKDPRVKELAAILSEQQGSQHAEVYARYQVSLQLLGDVERGRAIFTKHCSICHRLDNAGHEIGPNLATIQNRGTEAILVNVLDPNREVNPKYINYIVATNDGLIHTGMIQEETSTSVTLLRGEKKTETLLRGDIEQMKSTGKSLMPEGLHKEIDEQAMADLLAYLSAVR